MYFKSRLIIFLSLCFYLTEVQFIYAEERVFEKAAFNFLPKKSLNKKRLGINAYVNDQRFGTISSQFREVKNTLGLKYVRVLFNWNDQIQAKPNCDQFFGFYDEIASSLPNGTQALVIINGLPSWMSNPANWIDNNPRKTFIELWLKPVVKRYGKNKRIKAFQVWNEQNMEANNDNEILQIVNSPQNYVEMLAMAQNIIKESAPRRKVVTGATTAINQNYPESLNYNIAMQSAGAEQFTDVWAVHVYGSNLENFFLRDSLPDFLKGMKKSIWVTESGEKGTLKQKEYAQTMWPYLLGTFSKIKRIYIYQFTEATPASETYGLRNLTQGSFLSDLYIYLRSLKNKRK